MGEEESKTKREGAGWNEWERRKTRVQEKPVEKAGVENNFEKS